MSLSRDKVATLLFLTGCFIYLYVQDVALPFTPILTGDTAPIFIQDGMRMARGEVLYRDIFELTYPGAPFIYATLFRFFGVRAWIPTGVFIVLGLGLCWVGVIISRRLMNGTALFLPSGIFLG